MLLNDMKIVDPLNADPFVARVCDIFREEVAFRSGVELNTVPRAPDDSSYILIATRAALRLEYPEIYAKLQVAAPEPGREGFTISINENGDKTKIVVAGADGRGCLYGMARVLRKLYMKVGIIKRTPELVDTSITPKYQLRGHQLAYRDKQNTCPCWDIGEFDRYIRDLALFGSNAIEILPPRTDDRLFSSVFSRDPFEMMLNLSRVIHSYGMDVWLWYPNMGGDYNDPEVYQAELAEREKVFSQMPYIDAVLIPAGDPGDLHPKEFFPIVENSMKILHKHHPAARVWVSPQSSSPEPGWYERFYEEVDKAPDWLYGVCFAPWVRDTITEMHERLPDKYKNRIRHYPDITHSSSSQFEMPDWDMPFALTLGREAYNARPKAMKRIHNHHAPYVIGSITYSEGVHDDVNKMVWSDQDFNPDMSVEETIRDYIRLLIDPDIVDALSDLIIKIEANWIGYAAKNDNIDAVYNGFIELEKTLSGATSENYRYQMALLRALSDYQAKLRYIYDAQLEKDALDVLAAAPSLGSREAIRAARSIFRRTYDEPINRSLQRRIQQLADSLFAKIHIKLTTTRHFGQSWIRGAYLDSLDLPLNDYQWYMTHFSGIWDMPEEGARLAAIDRLLKRNDPGEGGYYDWLGDLDTFKERVVNDISWEDDPGYLRSPVINHDPYGLQMLMHHMRGWYNEFPVTLRWVGRARVLYGAPLKVRYRGLEPEAEYIIRLSYPILKTGKTADSLTVRLTAGGYIIHDMIDIRPHYDSWDPIYEYPLPKDSYRGDGDLKLVWQAYGKLNAFCVSEIWIIKKVVAAAAV